MAEKMSALEAYLARKLTLPPGYGLESRPDVLFLRREDDSVAAVFSVRGATPSEVARAAEEDHGKYGRSTS
jgi:hypothetical protein